jgi:hypothetical protein
VRVGNLELVQETVEPANVALIAHERLGGPGMGGINHPHAFKHEEGIERARWRQGGPNIGSHGAQFTNEGVAGKRSGEEEASGEVPVAGAERGANADAAQMIEITTGRIVGPVQREAGGSKEADPNTAASSAPTTAHACRRPAA